MSWCTLFARRSGAVSSVEQRPTLPDTGNELIASLPRADRSRLLTLCEPVHLQLSQVLGQVGQATRYAYFPTESVISLIAEVDVHHGLEVGMACLLYTSMGGSCAPGAAGRSVCQGRGRRRDFSGAGVRENSRIQRRDQFAAGLRCQGRRVIAGPRSGGDPAQGAHQDRQRHRQDDQGGDLSVSYTHLDVYKRQV